MKKAILVGLAFASLAACSGETTNEVTEEAEATEEATADTADATQTDDALVEGTQYHATTILDCGFNGAAPTESCNAGVIRNWGEDGAALVEVEKPDGFKRAIFFKGTEPYGADSAEADGSAGWDFKTTRDGDRVTINYGPETYVIVDALIVGG